MIELEKSLSSSFQDHRTQLIRALKKRPIGESISNIQAEFKTYRVGDFEMPICVLEANSKSSYVVSPMSQCILYPLQELHLLKNKFLEFFGVGALKSLGSILAWGGIDKCVVLNSLCLSTNLWGEPESQHFDQVFQELLRDYPDHCLIIRSLDNRMHKEFISKICSAGFKASVARQVFYFDGRTGSYLKKYVLKRDLKLAAKFRMRWLNAEEISEEHLKRAWEFFKQLYLEKHSTLNPQFSWEFWKDAFETSAFDLDVLVDQSNQAVAMAGYYETQDLLSTPMVGYDLARPAEEGLYRILVCRVLERAAKKKKLLNFSSGAGEFKRRRGGESEIEYLLSYSEHLPLKRRLAWGTLEKLSKSFAKPVLEKWTL